MGLRKKLAARIKGKPVPTVDDDGPPPYDGPPKYSHLGITDTDVVNHFVNSLHVSFLTDNYDIRVKERCDATGEWTLSASAFLQWKGDSRSSYLWSSGKPGAGKSVISAMLAKQLRHEVSSSKESPGQNVSVACIFLDYSSAEREADMPTLVAKSLISQLGPFSMKDGKFPTRLEKVSRLSSPTYDDYMDSLDAIVSRISSAYIIIDALDECDRDSQARILALVDRLLLPRTKAEDEVSQGSKKVHVMLSSRKNDIILAHYETAKTKNGVLSASTLEVRATDQDIKTYVDRTLSAYERQMKQDRKSTPLLQDESLRNEVISTLTEKAGGMFLWAKLQTSLVKTLHDRSAIQDFLHNLPVSEEIENTYIQMLHKIQTQEPERRLLAQKALLWVTYAVRPLSSDELQDGAEIDETSTSDSDDKPYGAAGRQLLASCANFIEISGTTVSFVHYTAMEFFRRTGRDLVRKSLNGSTEFDHFFPGQSKAHLQLGRWSTLYLLRAFGKEKPTFAIEQPGWFLMMNQLAHYACANFDQHLYRAQDVLNDETVSLVENFLASEGGILEGFMLVRNMESIWDIMAFESMKFWPGNTTRNTIIRTTALQLIPRFALPPAESIDAEIQRNKWILHHAAFSGDIDLVESILKNISQESGFISKEDTRGATALYYAARQGFIEICRRLIDIGGIPLDAGHAQSNPLQVAALNGHLAVVKLLLDKGADSRAQGGLYNTPLQAASWNGHYGIVDELLKRGKKSVDVNAKAESDTPRAYCALQAAAFRGHDAIVRRLIDAGADVDIPEPYPSQFGLPLQAAIQGGHLSTAKILLDAGADINAKSGETEAGGTALIAASANGDDTAVRFLIERGAIVVETEGDATEESGLADGKSDSELSGWESADSEYGSLDGQTALHWALAHGHQEVVNTLLSHGASLTRVADKYGNAVQAAVTGGNEYLVRKALDAGIDVNAPGGYFATSLIAAAQQGNVNIARILLGAGANIEPIDRNYGNALDAACYAGHYDVAELLLDRGASVRNALPEIASNGNIDLAKKVLDRGADVNAICRSPYQTALQAAASGGLAEMVQLLLKHGADPNYIGGVYGTALHAAISNGSLETIKHLVDAGADVNSPYGQEPEGTPLQAACLKMDEETVRYLLGHGAKVNLETPCGEFGSALQAAVTKNWGPVVRLLLDSGADVHAQGGRYTTALNAAKELQNDDLVKLLMERI